HNQAGRILTEDAIVSREPPVHDAKRANAQVDRNQMITGVERREHPAKGSFRVAQNALEQLPRPLEGEYIGRSRSAILISLPGDQSGEYIRLRGEGQKANRSNFALQLSGLPQGAP